MFFEALADTTIDTQRIGRMGELVVELELLARGWLVGNFNATTMNSAGWDLFATKAGRSVRIRVKAKRPGTSCFVWSKKRDGRVFDLMEGDADDFVAAVSFEVEGSPRVYLLPSAKVEGDLLGNRVSLHPDKVDRFGVPLMRFDVTFRENEIRMMDDARTEGEKMLKAAGLINVTSGRSPHVPGDAIHEMGGARMGADSRESVVNQWSQAHDAPNLFITDGAQMASNSCVNPSLTFMAFTARAADYAVKQLKAGAI